MGSGLNLSLAKPDVAGEKLVLTTDQQTTHTSAASMTNDHGWCSGKRWGYYAHEGQANAFGRTARIQYPSGRHRHQS